MLWIKKEKNTDIQQDLDMVRYWLINITVFWKMNFLSLSFPPLFLPFLSFIGGLTLSPPNCCSYMSSRYHTYTVAETVKCSG